MSGLHSNILRSLCCSCSKVASGVRGVCTVLSGMEHLKRYRFVLLGVVILVTISTRLLPIAISPFPFNNDGITESRIAADILESRHLDYPEDAYYYGSHSTVTPAYNLLVAFSSSLLGSSTFWVAQYVVGMIALTTIVGAYLIALKITSSPPAAFVSSFVLALFGTFVFLTGSSWKESLGVAVLVLLVYSYMRRDQPRMMALMAITLAVLPLVHHFVAVLVYLSLWFLTIWSIAFAANRKVIRSRHVKDLGIIAVATLASYSYYSANSFDRLSLFSEPSEMLFGVVVFFLMTVTAYWYLHKKSRMSVSFAPIPASAVLILFSLDYFDPMLGYEQGSPVIVFVLVVSMAILVGLGWLGMEMLVESGNRYRAVPFAVLLPLAIVIAYALVIKSGYWSHWMIYRTYDFSDISLALGAGVVAKSLLSKPWRKQWLLVLLLCALVFSFPFSYWTGALTGVRHDTQYYEYDAISWTHVSYEGEYSIRSDERLSYNAQALYDVGKDPYLPTIIYEYKNPEPGKMNLFLEEWCIIGVDAYPEGHPVLDLAFVERLISESDVFYVGGPVENNIVGFVT